MMKYEPQEAGTLRMDMSDIHLCGCVSMSRYVSICMSVHRFECSNGCERVDECVSACVSGCEVSDILQQ